MGGCDAEGLIVDNTRVGSLTPAQCRQQSQSSTWRLCLRTLHPVAKPPILYVYSPPRHWSIQKKKNLVTHKVHNQQSRVAITRCRRKHTCTGCPERQRSPGVDGPQAEMPDTEGHVAMTIHDNAGYAGFCGEDAGWQVWSESAHRAPGMAGFGDCRASLGHT